MRVLYKFMMRPGREPEVRKAAGGVSEDQFREWGLVGHFFFRGSAMYAFFEAEDGDPMDLLLEEKGAKKLLDALEKDTNFNREHTKAHRFTWHEIQARAEVPA